MARRDEFDSGEVEGLLVACHRRCCVCHRFCGVKIEVDHIMPAAEGGDGSANNAIPLCFDCHAEVHHYNVSHPKGRRFRPSELRAHKEQWLALCRERPDMFVHAMPSPEAGSLERLLSEMQFNFRIASWSDAYRDTGTPYELLQFRRALADGTFTWLEDDLKRLIQDAYVLLIRANRFGEGLTNLPMGDARTESQNAAHKASQEAKAALVKAMDLLVLSLS